MTPRRQSKKEANQPAAQLTCDVDLGKGIMKAIHLFLLISLVVSGLVAAEDKPREEDRVEVRVVRLAGGDGSKKENRLLVFGYDAFRTVDELKQRIAIYRGLPRVLHVVIHGVDVAGAPRLTSDEIEDLRRFCLGLDLRFTYVPGG
jgi:hypothetical protein